jgi:hypothetical protein
MTASRDSASYCYRQSISYRDREEAIPLVVCRLVGYRRICARVVIPEPVLLWWSGLNGLKVLSLSPLLASDRELSKSIGLVLPLLCHIRLPVARAFRGENLAIASFKDVF